jgi:hypothetical protein
VKQPRKHLARDPDDARRLGHRVVFVVDEHADGRHAVLGRADVIALSASVIRRHARSRVRLGARRGAPYT